MTTTNAKKAAKKERVKFMIITAIMLGAEDNGWFGQMKDDLVNDYTKGNNTYLETPDALLSLMNL